MNKIDSTLVPYELDSPVEFILVGVVGKRRAIVAKSKGAKIDLAAYAQKEHSDYEDRPYPLQLFPFASRMQLRPLSVDSQPTEFYSNHVYDERASEWTLVWRGVGYGRYKERIRNEFQKRIGEIVESLDDDSGSHLEWAVSPVIDLCNRANSYATGKRLRFVSAMWFTVLIYIVGIAAYLLSSQALK